jgi:hypothetical protein
METGSKKMKRNDPRSTDFFERIEVYPQPPIIPLPQPGDIESMARMGIYLNPTSRRIINLFIKLSGFSKFQKELPEHVEHYLRTISMRFPGLQSPVINATAAFRDDPRQPSAVERAATLVFAVYSLYEDVMSGKLPPDEFRGQPLEMGQYPNLFSTSLFVQNKKVTLYKSKKNTQITVIMNRKLYTLEVGKVGTETTIEQVILALEEIVQRARANPLKADMPAPGFLTCGTNETQFRIFNNLRKIPVNVASLEALRDSLFTLCLDLESHPQSDAEAAYFAHSCNFGNRWNHSSLQLVVFGNAKACAILNFTAHLDGNMMSRAAAEIQRRGCLAAYQSPAKGSISRLAEAVELKWKLHPRMEQSSRFDISQMMDNQQATFVLPDMGKNFFKKLGVEAVPTFILALQMTADRLINRRAKITQFLTMSRYRCMDLTHAHLNTPEMLSCAELFNQGKISGEEARARLAQAIESQQQAARKARQYLNLPVIIALYALSSRGLKQVYINFLNIMMRLSLRMLGLMKIGPREILVSHPEIYDEIPMIGRPGVRLPYVRYFGLHYQIMDEKTVITMMPAVVWTVPNAAVIEELRKSLEIIREALS